MRTCFENTLDIAFFRQRVPVYRQGEAAECGLACIAMIASFWGRHLDLRAMRTQFAVSLKGTTLKSLMDIGQRLSMRARPVRLEPGQLGKMKLPCVLHWDLNHFVVLCRTNGKSAVIHDPAVGRRKIDRAELAKHFSGVALELTPAAGFQQADERTSISLRALIGSIHGIGTGIAKLLSLGLLLQICALAAPLYLQLMVDQAIATSDYSLVNVIACFFVLSVAVQVVISMIRSWITSVIAAEVNFQWFGNTFAHLLKLPLIFFEKRHLGDVVSRFGSIQTIQRNLTTQFVESLLDGLLVICALAVMITYSPDLSAISGTAVVLYFLVRGGVYRRLQEATAEQILAAAKQSTFFIESARGVQTIKLFNRGAERCTGWMNLLADQFNAELRVARISISYQAASTFIFGVERILVIWIAAYHVMSGQFSIGMIFAFLGFKDQFSQRMSASIDKLFEFRMLRLHADRLADILLERAENGGADLRAEVPGLQPRIQIRNLSFRYSDYDPLVLDHIDLEIEPGESLAITGASGCGKTTLVKLLLGLLTPTEGDILIDGVPLRAYGLDNYRNRVGAILQEDRLFSGSIAQNICFFNPHPDAAEIERVAQLASIATEIQAMAMRYDTFVGDIGHGLSGGQVQRILLARALYRKPGLLILDEATSHLDVQNEFQVNAAVKALALTRIIVAHRPETIASAERVVELANGRLVCDRRRDDTAVMRAVAMPVKRQTAMDASSGANG
jgi:ATP-binding cassette subfamily B protein RaxB